MKFRVPALTALLASVLAPGLEAQKPAPKAPQKIDDGYTRPIVMFAFHPAHQQ